MYSLQGTSRELLSSHPPFALEESSWFAIQTRPRYEKKVAAGLQEKGLKAFIPLNSVLHHWSDRRRLVHLPLFPGYVFVRTTSSPDARMSVLCTAGVTSFVGVRNMGTPIPDCEIEAIQTIFENKVPFEPFPHLRIGQRVRICSGCLDGLTGILTTINGDQSLIVSVNVIQRSVAMRLDGYHIEPI